MTEDEREERKKALEELKSYIIWMLDDFEEEPVIAEYEAVEK
jgi:hypothetical protein